MVVCNRRTILLLGVLSLLLASSAYGVNEEECDGRETCLTCTAQTKGIEQHHFERSLKMNSSEAFPTGVLKDPETLVVFRDLKRNWSNNVVFFSFRRSIFHYE